MLILSQISKKNCEKVRKCSYPLGLLLDFNVKNLELMSFLKGIIQGYEVSGVF